MPFPRGPVNLRRVPTPRVDEAEFWLGLVDFLEPDMIPPHALALSKNVEPGTLKKRRGTQAHNSSAPVASRVLGAHPYYDQANSARQLVWMVGTTLYRDDNVSIKTGLNGSSFEATTFKDTMFYVTGHATDGYRQWDRSTEQQVTAYTPGANEDANELKDTNSPIHASKYITSWQGRVFLGGSASLPFRVWPSDLARVLGTNNLPDYFKSTAPLDLNPQRGGKITGFAPAETALFVLMDTAVFVILSDSSSNLSAYEAVPDVGCLSGRTAKFAPGIGLLFLDERANVRVLQPIAGFDGRYTTKVLTKHIAGTTRQANLSQLSNAAAGIWRNYYWVAVPTGNATQPNQIWVADLTRVAPDPWGDPNALFVPWSVYEFGSGVAPGSVLVTWDDGTHTRFIAGDTATGRLWRLDQDDVWADNSNAYTVDVKTAKLHFGWPDRKKTIRKVHIRYFGVSASNTLSTKIYVDDLPATSLASIDMLGAASSYNVISYNDEPYNNIRSNVTKRLLVGRTGTAFQLQFTNTSTSQPMEIYSLIYQYTLRNVI